MVRKLIFIIFLILNTNSYAKENLKCDEIFYRQLRYGYHYLFDIKFINNNNYAKKMKKIKWEFSEKYDLNNGENPTFNKYAKELKDNNYIIPANSSVVAVKANRYYNIKYKPIKSSNSDIFIKYTFLYTKYINNKRVGKVLSHISCVNYKVTWCGNGSLEEEYEECDPSDPKHLGWGSKGCSNKCKSLN